MSDKIKEISEKFVNEFKDLEVEENEEKFIFSLVSIKNKETNEFQINEFIEGNRLDIIEVITFLLKSEKENDIQVIFEAIKEHI